MTEGRSEIWEHGGWRVLLVAVLYGFVYLGGGRVLGPIPDGAADSSVQVVAIKDVPEKFAGWMHVDDLGTGVNAAVTAFNAETLDQHFAVAVVSDRAIPLPAP